MMNVVFGYLKKCQNVSKLYVLNLVTMCSRTGYRCPEVSYYREMLFQVSQKLKLNLFYYNQVVLEFNLGHKQTEELYFSCIYLHGQESLSVYSNKRVYCHSLLTWPTLFLYLGIDSYFHNRKKDIMRVCMHVSALLYVSVIYTNDQQIDLDHYLHRQPKCKRSISH